MPDFSEEDLETAEYPFPTVSGKVMKFFLPKGDAIGGTIRNTRAWDYSFITHLYSWAADRGSYIEVGANIGTDSVLAREYFQTCYAFEPLSYNRWLFNKNVERNAVGNIQLFPYAVSDKPGVTRLYIPDTRGVSGCSLKPDAAQGQTYEDVQTVTLDEALPPEITNVSFLQIDTEGHDIKVLRGAKNFIRRQKMPPMIKMEFQPKMLKAHDTGVEEFLAFIEEFHYRPAMNAAATVAPITPRALADFFALWQSSTAWIDVFLLP
jgi:FkbM family methyltransferase